MEPNTRVTSSQLLFEWNACGQSSFLWKSWTNFVSLQTSSGFMKCQKLAFRSPDLCERNITDMMKRASLRCYLSVSCVREIPHHPRLHWNREAAMPARPAHAKPLLGLSPVGISAEGSGAHAAISFPSLHSPSWQQLSSWHLQPWPSGISRLL